MAPIYKGLSLIRNPWACIRSVHEVLPRQTQSNWFHESSKLNAVSIDNLGLLAIRVTLTRIYIYGILFILKNYNNLIWFRKPASKWKACADNCTFLVPVKQQMKKKTFLHCGIYQMSDCDTKQTQVRSLQVTYRWQFPQVMQIVLSLNMEIRLDIRSIQGACAGQSLHQEQPFGYNRLQSSSL